MSVRRAARDIARPVAKGASRVLTVPTTGARALPDFLIIGAQRCGTTSLYRYLASHPAVVPAVLNKGIHYFDTEYGKSLAWYRSHFPSRPYLAYVRARRRVARVVTGEGSPYYVFHPLAPARIAQVLPHARFVLMLRDPVSRAHSHYQHEVARGFETLSFEEALEREDERLDGEEDRMRADPSYYSFEHQHHSYVARGKYLGQILRWQKQLPPEQLLIVESGEFFDDPESTYRSVLSFLGLEEHSLPAYEKLNMHSYVEMSDAARSHLHARLDGPTRELYDFLGRDLGWGEGSTP